MPADEFVRIPAHFWHTALPPEVPRWGAVAKAAMRDGYRRTLHVMGPVQEIPDEAAMVSLDPRVRDRLGLPVARLSGSGHPEDQRTASFLEERALEWAEASGAERTWPWPRPRAGARLSGGQHQAGTCRMGEDPVTSVCDPNGALHDFPNVVLADASVHVTNGGLNPALSVMALAWRDAVVDAGLPDLAGAVRSELGESGDVVFDCVANQQTVPEAIKIALKGGTVVVVGGARKPVTIDLPMVQEFQVRLQGATTYRREDFEDAARIIGGGDFDAGSFITATFPLPRAKEAFAAINSGQEVKILVVAEAEAGA
jgi:hypothetical protein